MDSHCSQYNYDIKMNLDDLKKRLQKGSFVKGRIIDCPKENRYVLRVWGYNIYTESEKFFRKNDEVNLEVKELEPKLVFDMKIVPKEKPISNRTNIII